MNNDLFTIKKQIMANRCSNRVEFIGEHHQFRNLKTFFEAMAAKEKKEGGGQLPAFAEMDEGYFFEVSWEDGILYYQTKWTPNLYPLKAIADHFGVGFVCSYAEPGNRVFGETTYKDGFLIDVFLDNGDFSRYQYDDEKEAYTFENESYGDSDEILEILLERKKALRFSKP